MGSEMCIRDRRNGKPYVQAWCGFFHDTIAYLKGNSKIKEKLFKKILPQIRKTYVLAPKLGVDLYTGSTYTRVNTVTRYSSMNVITPRIIIVLQVFESHEIKKIALAAREELWHCQSRVMSTRSLI